MSLVDNIVLSIGNPLIQQFIAPQLGKLFMEEDFEKAKFEFEKWKAEEDIKLRRDELTLELGELEIKRAEAAKSKWSSPLLLGILGLIATILASVVQNSWQTFANRKLEQSKFESTLMQKALETDDQLVAARRLKRLLDLHLISDQDGTIAGWVSDPASIPVDVPGEAFAGGDRKAAKLSIGSGKVEHFDNVAALLGSLPPKDFMLSHSPPITTVFSSARVTEEQRNVHLSAFLYAASREADNDYHLIIGDDPKAPQQLYLTAEVSGLPPSTSPAFIKLKAARSSFAEFFGNNLPEAGFGFYDPPIPVELEGSLFFDAAHGTGQVPGPRSLKPHMPTIWEIHPVTSIRLGNL